MLIDCSLRELRQVNLGNVLLLRGLWLSVMVACSGGGVIVEHPTAPREDHQPSIWKTSVVQHLLTTGLFSLHHVLQFHYGAVSVKPTTFLCARVNKRTLEQHARRDFVRPSKALVGRTEDGQFQTFSAKEYPPGLNRALAESLLCDAEYAPEQKAEPVWWKTATDFHQASMCTSLHTILADFQFK